MGLEEIDLDLDDLMDSTDDKDSSTEDISDLSKKELYRLVEKKGQINLGNNRAVIMCPCSKGALIGSHSTRYICALSMRPDPEDGKQKPVCSGPILGLRTFESGKEEWKPGDSPSTGCPYSPYRFMMDD